MNNLFSTGSISHTQEFNGFKIRDDGNACNGGQSGGGGTYIYMAWAHQPMNNLYGAQSNAR